MQLLKGRMSVSKERKIVNTDYSDCADYAESPLVSGEEGSILTKDNSSAQSA
jgi:hypothetical protein